MNFWDVHGVLFLIGMMVFPRFVMLFFVAAPFGVLAWIGWVFAPYVTAAVLATAWYWDTNPVLCVLTWVFALGGTAGEGTAASRVSTK